MATPKDTLQKAYGNVPREVGYSPDFDFVILRGIRYYWYRFIRKITR